MTSRLPSWLKLFLISFATLFFEILVIRFVASEIRIFAFMKNLALMACVLGLGIGCSSITKENKDKFQNPIISFVVLLSALSLILVLAPVIGLNNITFVFSPDIFNWQFGTNSVLVFLANVLSIICLFVLLVAIFDFLGQELGKQIADFPPLAGYGINLAGSLLGVVAFSALCFACAPPSVWLAIGLASLVVFTIRGESIFSKESGVFIVLSLAIISLAQLCTGQSIWTPYYRIDLKPLNVWFQNGVEIYEPFRLGTIVEVNHMRHQAPFNFSEAFFRQHPQLYGSSDYLTYNLPYTAKPNPEKVLVLGAGTGNDLAVCLQHNPKQIDAVEIDPGILSLGRTIHPQLPYSDPRVHPHINDARLFLASHHDQYDLIIFGYLDSHTALSTMSSLRLDNYLYTKESIESATAHLNKDGVASLSFSAQPLWLQARLYQLVKTVSKQEPIVIRTGYEGGSSLAILWGPGLETTGQALLTKYAERIIPGSSLSFPVDIPTDDWPFLYQAKRDIPAAYLAMLIFVLTISSAFVFSRFRLRRESFVDNAQFFFLGAGFLLLETRGILSVAVLFGSTWLVNSIVIGTILMMAMVSNGLVARFRNINQSFCYLSLFVALVLNYLMPLSAFAGASIFTRSLAAFSLIGLPFIFTGLIFSRAFSRSQTPQLALGVNILGAIAGGCLEYFSTVSGTASLTLIAMALYLLSFAVRNQNPNSPLST